jgi:hypothetical protein
VWDVLHLFYVLLTVHLDIRFDENQLDAQFIFSLFCQSTSTCFRYVYCPSSGGIHCIGIGIGAPYAFDWLLTRSAASQMYECI